MRECYRWVDKRREEERRREKETRMVVEFNPGDGALECPSLPSHADFTFNDSIECLVGTASSILLSHSLSLFTSLYLELTSPQGGHVVPPASLSVS